MNKLNVHVEDASDCQVVVGSNLADTIKETAIRKYSKVLIVTDELLYQRIGKTLYKHFSQITPTIAQVIPKGEEAKSLEVLEQLLYCCQINSLDKQSIVVALGGGSVSDVAGFAASIYMRGIDWVVIPTTLLSQVDAAIGGKTGINFYGIKNMIGTIHPPKNVYCDVSTLESLPHREFSSGMAEIIKYAVTLDPNLVDILESQTINSKSNELEEIIFRSIELKAKIVEKDHREATGLRHILNFGHTLGHAIESVAGFGKYTHGEAIAVGMVYAAKLSEAMDLCTNQDVKKIVDVLHRYSLPSTIKLPHDKLIEAIQHDKKTMNGKTKWVLIQGIGKTVTDQQIPEEIVRKVLKTL